MLEDPVPVRAVRPPGPVADRRRHDRDVLGEGRHRLPRLRDDGQVRRGQAHPLQQHQREAGLEISAGKMSHLWSGRPISIRLDDLDIICAVLGCDPGDLLIRDPAAAKPGRPQASAAAAAVPAIRPSRRGGRSLPPV